MGSASTTTPEPSHPDLEIQCLLQGVQGITWEGQTVSSDQPFPAALFTPANGQQHCDDFQSLASHLAHILADVHRRGLLHTAIHPGQLRWRGTKPMLAGFQSAIRRDAAQLPPRPLPRQLDRLSYLAPEQTGRCQQPLDERTDLYALGATLYTLATGVKPFQGSSRADLIQALLSKPPQPPQELAPWLAPAVAAILLRLLAKEPDQRYASAEALLADLNSLPAGKGAANQPPARHPKAPGLHGRQAQQSLLLSVLQQSCRSAVPAMFVVGKAGVGKTTLVRELEQPVRLLHGQFVLGKCEQFGSTAVLPAPRQALRSLLSMLLTLHELQSVPLGQDLRQELGPDAGALLPLLPELQGLTGTLPTPSNSTVEEAPRRLLRLLVTLVALLARQAGPLVLVLDDLQWADPLTLELVAALLEPPGLPGLLLVGLSRTGAALQRHAASSCPATEIALANLPPEPLGALVADMLQSDIPGLAELSAALHRSTEGNPFFTTQLVHTLHREGLLQFSATRQSWCWDLAAIDARVGGTDVVQFLIGSLLLFPEPSRKALAALACLGSQVPLSLLATATGLSSAELVVQLQPAWDAGVLVFNQPTEDCATGSSSNLVAHFSHDRLQQAANKLGDSAALQQLHLAIARRLLHAGQRSLATSNYAQAIGLLDQQPEQHQVAELLQEASAEALAAGDYAASERLLLLALPLLGPAPWRQQPQAAWELHVALHQLQYCHANYAQADVYYDELVQRAAAPEVLLGPCSIQVMALANRGHYTDAVDLASTLLHQLGLEMPLQQPEPMLERELAIFEQAVQAGALERLPPLVAQKLGKSTVARLMNRLVPATFFCNPPLASWLVLHSTQQWLNGDADPARLYPLACSLLATVPLRDDYATGYRAARMALSLGEAGDYGVETARTRHVFSLFSCHWFEPVEMGLAQAHRAHEELLRCGELEFACYTFFTSQAALLDCGPSLVELAEENTRALAFAQLSGNRHAEPAYAAFATLIARLSSSGGPLPEGTIELTQTNPMADCYAHICQGLAACLLGDRPTLARHAKAATALEPYITGFYPVALIRLLASFDLLWRWGQGGDRNKTALAAPLDALQAWFAARASDAPQNYAHLADLISAERLVAEGRAAEALPKFERAVRGAIAHRRPWHAALATERAARCYLTLELEQAGHLLLEQAHRRYGAWGASLKTAALEAEFPFLRYSLPHASDLNTLLEANQQLSSLRSVPELAQATAELVARLSGATDVQILALDALEGWQLQAGFSPSGGLPQQGLAEAEGAALLPATAVRLALRMLQPVISDDAVLDGRFTDDPHFKAMALCSLLVVPVVVQNRAIAVVIVENQLLRSVFEPALARSLELVCSHLALALENLLIQKSLQQQVKKRTLSLQSAYEREARNEQQRRALLEQKLKTSLSAAAVVHEIQQPLNSILLNCRMAMASLQSLPAGAIPEELTGQLSQLTVDGAQVVTTMERMRMLLRNVETKPTPLDLSNSLESTLIFLKRDLQKHGATIIREGLEQPCPLHGDSAQLQIAVVNLIRNALQAMEQQPPASRQLLLQLVQEPEMVEVRIGDSGPGFPPNFDCSRSWELLKSTKINGMGIGLFVAQTAVSNHRGTLRIGRCKRLGGAEVGLLLPRPSPLTPSPRGD